MASKHKPLPSLSTKLPENNEPVAHTPVRKTVPTLPAKTPTKSPVDWSSVDPDDLFVRLTIPEIRSVQAKLRADADAKQEELRLMVGERYRDLLQASTSIISIAGSSKSVISALAEMREAMAPDESEQKPRRSSIREKDDAHLKALQSLSAHLKLLLDAPEHLWRLLEKKQHFSAAWLFLLARVVHRALVTENPEESWEREGINVSAQFPLVQRQWDIVAQFRSQIAHKAAQYLRESSISSETACSTVLTLHLIDLLPLLETLSTLLSQRSRTLNTLAAQSLDRPSPSRPGSPFSKGRRKNPEVADKTENPPGTMVRKPVQYRKGVVKAVRVAVLELLDIIAGTVCIARDVFRAEDGKRSLVERVLEDIQSDIPPSSVLTTATLLSTLPSSAHLLTLPQSILNYKPYIDLTSPSTHIDRTIVDTKLSAWFNKATQAFAERLHTWFEGLETIREVWKVRKKVLHRLQASRGLEEREQANIRSALDDNVKDRVNEIARTALKDVVESVDGALQRVVGDVINEMEDTQVDVSPSTFLLSPPPIASISQLGSNPGSVSFKTFKNALRQRADGRTPCLDRFMTEIEYKARELEKDLEAMSERDQTSYELQQQVMAIHYPAAESSLKRIVEVLAQLVAPESTDIEGPSEKSITAVIFLGRISHSMMLSSFGKSLRCQEEALQDFRSELESLHERSLARWRTYTVSKAFKECEPVIAALKNTRSISTDFIWPSQPSPHLINALLALASGLQCLGLTQAELHSKRVSISLVHEFKDTFAEECSVEGHVFGKAPAQLLWDLTLLRQLPHMQRGSTGNPDDTTGDVLSTKAASLRSLLRSSTQEETFSKFSAHIEQTIDHYLLRCQTLLAPLIGTVSPSKSTLVNGNAPEHTSHSGIKSTILLPFGAPISEQDFRPAMEIAKPSARFGLILVGSTTT